MSCTNERGVLLIDCYNSQYTCKLVNHVSIHIWFKNAREFNLSKLLHFHVLVSVKIRISKILVHFLNFINVLSQPSGFKIEHLCSLIVPLSICVKYLLDEKEKIGAKLYMLSQKNFVWLPKMGTFLYRINFRMSTPVVCLFIFCCYIDCCFCMHTACVIPRFPFFFHTHLFCDLFRPVLIVLFGNTCHLGKQKTNKFKFTHAVLVYSEELDSRNTVLHVFNTVSFCVLSVIADYVAVLFVCPVLNKGLYFIIISYLKTPKYRSKRRKKKSKTPKKKKKKLKTKKKFQNVY